MTSKTKQLAAEGAQLNNRFGEMIIKCADFMKEADAGVKPSLRVLEACNDIMIGYIIAMETYFIEYKDSVEVGER